MHIIKWELKANLKSLLIWCAIFAALIFMMTSEFSAYYNNPEMADIMEMFPESMLKAFSMENANLTTTTGYLSLVALYFYLMAGVFAVLLGSGIIAKEERDKTAEYLMTMPISREKIILSKLIAAMINCLILLAIIFGATILAMYNYDLDSTFFAFIYNLGIAIFLEMMIFMSIGMFLASVLKRYKSSGKIAASLLILLYFINVAIGLSKNLAVLEYVTPFKYFNAQDILQTGHLELKFVMLSIGITVVGIIGTFLIYPRRDLHI